MALPWLVSVLWDGITVLRQCYGTDSTGGPHALRCIWGEC